jgi:hypothetical protein
VTGRITSAPRGSLRFDRRRRPSLYLGGSFVVRQNGDAWAATTLALGGGLNGEFHPKGHLTLRTGTGPTTGRSATCQTSQFEQRGFASVLANFGRTTIIAEVNVSAKMLPIAGSCSTRSS